MAATYLGHIQFCSWLNWFGEKVNKQQSARTFQERFYRLFDLKLQFYLCFARSHHLHRPVLSFQSKSTKFQAHMHSALVDRCIHCSMTFLLRNYSHCSTKTILQCTCPTAPSTFANKCNTTLYLYRHAVPICSQAHWPIAFPPYGCPPSLTGAMLHYVASANPPVICWYRWHVHPTLDDSLHTWIQLSLHKWHCQPNLPSRKINNGWALPDLRVRKFTNQNT